MYQPLSSSPTGDYLIRISICGFPMYACGHNYLLLLGADKSMLAHVGVKVPDTFNQLPPIEYWMRNLFTNTLEKTVTSYGNLQLIADKIKETCEKSLKITITKWEISKDIFKVLYENFEKEINGEKLDNFCFMGQWVGSWVGGGSNCMDWMHYHMKTANITEQSGMNISYDNLMHLIASY